MSALDALAAVADPGSFSSWDDPLDHPGASEEYREDLATAVRGTGSDEAVTTGQVGIGGVRAAIIAWEFGFLGGSVGVATATRVVAAIRRATAAGLPLLALPRSGGTRMQEGSPAFVQMIAITAAVAAHREAGLPYLVHLCGPTTGGVLATLGSAGDYTSAEPGAMVGFLGPRAYAAITGEQFPEGVQTAENLARRGVIDAVLPWPEVAQRWAVLLRLWADRPRAAPEGGSAAGRAAPAAAAGEDPGPAGGGPARHPGAPATAAALWEYVAASRATDRMDAEQFIAAQMTDVVALPGTGCGELASGTTVVLGRLGDLPIILVATEDRRTGQPLTVGGLRTVRRAVRLAGRWGLPVVTIVDTLGAQLSVSGEESGIAGEISRVMLEVVSTPSATAALLLGAGTGGAALAMLATDVIVAGSHTWVAPLAPEGAAAIRHGGSHDPAQLAWQQQIGAHALADLGFIDVIVRESDPRWVAAAAQALRTGLLGVLGGAGRRRAERFAAWR